MVVRRFDVYLVTLDPTVGSEIRKTRPCLIISPDAMNKMIRTIIIAPMTSKTRPYPSRINCTFQGKEGQIALDQLRTIDKQRLGQKLGTIDEASQDKVIATLSEMFAK